MIIEEMTRQECFHVLKSTRLARLACAFQNQPYIVPVYLAFHGPPEEEPCFFGFTTPGQKVEWMRANPLVCVEVDEVKSFNDWVSVVVRGRYEELAQAQQNDPARLPARSNALQRSSVADETIEGAEKSQVAHDVLQTTGIWWEPGVAAWKARSQGSDVDSFTMTYYKIHVDDVTGHRAIRDVAPLGQS